MRAREKIRKAMTTVMSSFLHKLHDEDREIVRRNSTLLFLVPNIELSPTPGEQSLSLRTSRTGISSPLPGPSSRAAFTSSDNYTLSHFNHSPSMVSGLSLDRIGQVVKRFVP